MTTIPTLNGTDVTVTEYHLRIGGDGGPAGTLYHGDAEIISDYLARPEGECHVQGVMHHIYLSHEAGRYSLTIDFVGNVATAEFDGMSAREIIFALATIPMPEYSNPHRP